jgi:hypothetical protein
VVILSENTELRFSKRVNHIPREKEFLDFILLSVELIASFFESVGPALPPLVNKASASATAVPSGSDGSCSSFEGKITAGDINLLESTSFSDSETYCQICGDLIGQDYVICTVCEIPHHQDCWEYNGRCSTFGCPSHSFKKPLIKKDAITLN